MPADGRRHTPEQIERQLLTSLNEINFHRLLQKFFFRDEKLSHVTLPHNGDCSQGEPVAKHAWCEVTRTWLLA